MVRLTYEWCSRGGPQQRRISGTLFDPEGNVINSREKDIYRCDDVHAFGGLAD